ncbi:MAG: glutamate--tRNA ligase [Clostridia bacterium]
MKEVRTRFAPSPTGFMHIGNLRTGLYAYLFARANNGKFILRIEDTDSEREVPGAVDFIYRTLSAAGITTDEGPLNGGAFAPYVQSERKEIYLRYAKELVALGGAYPCFCDKARLESLTDENGNRKYDKHCLSLSKEEVALRIAAGESFVIRQNIPLSEKTAYTDLVYGEIVVDTADLEDNVLLKSDGMPTYNFANVVDDHLMQISHVIRGTEYLSSTPKYNLIYNSFGWTPPQYIHLPPIMKDAQRKLSKRYGDANFEDFLAKGYLPHTVINYIALLGWSPKNNEEKFTMDELIALFGVEGLSRSGSIFDEDKMRWLNGLYIKELSPEDFAKKAAPYYDSSAIKGKYDYDKFNRLLHTRIDIFGEIPDKVKFITEFGAFDTELFLHKKNKITYPIAKTALEGAISALSALTDFSETAISDALILKCEELGLKKGQMFWVVRVGATGQAITPGGAIEMLDILGKQESLERLKFSLGLLL